MAAQLDLWASRNVAWAPTIELDYIGGPLPLDGATIAMQVRLYPGAPGAALVGITPIGFDDVATPTAAEPDRRVLYLWPGIAQAPLAALASGLNQPEPGEADRYAFDIVITYSDGAPDLAASGYFYLQPGVTR